MRTYTALNAGETICSGVKGKYTAQERLSADGLFLCSDAGVYIRTFTAHKITDILPQYIAECNGYFVNFQPVMRIITGYLRYAGRYSALGMGARQSSRASFSLQSQPRRFSLEMMSGIR